MPGAIIVGASSGIGEALARVLAARGYTLGLVARREDLLARLQAELPVPSHIRRVDISDPETAMPALGQLIADMGDVELFVLNAGVGFLTRDLEWDVERETIEVNVLGFAAMLNVAFQALKARGSGHIVGISSISALRGGRHAPAYNASKAFVSNYLEGIRHYCRRHSLPITVTDIQPGFVKTAMAKSDRLFWMATAGEAARQIDAAIVARRPHAYITRRWRLIAWLLKSLPRSLYERT
jgi:short-subunit dehydrogenase